MARTTVLMEREGQSVVDCLTSRLVCTLRKEGSFSLHLRESGGLGSIRHRVAQRIRCPKKFVNALLSLTRWSDLTFDDKEITEEMCARLSKLDPAFADAVAEDVCLRRLEKHLMHADGREIAA